MTDPKCGEKADITIKNVRIVSYPSARLVRIVDKHGDTFDMPPQAAITRPGEAADDRVASVLSLLDSMETEGGLQPYVAAAVRTKLGLPPRNWPPQAGDVWSDGCPFTDLWFARKLQAAGGGWNEAAIVMTCVEVGMRTHSPDELLESSPELTLIYRQGGRS